MGDGTHFCGSAGQGLDRVAVGDVGGLDSHLVPVAAQPLGGGLGRLLTVGGEQQGTAGPDTAGDRLADAAGADDHDDFLRFRAHAQVPLGHAVAVLVSPSLSTLPVSAGYRIPSEGPCCSRYCQDPQAPGTGRWRGRRELTRA